MGRRLGSGGTAAAGVGLPGGEAAAVADAPAATAVAASRSTGSVMEGG